ncbi:MAG: 2-dehydropantoate 2-reductase, partial [Bacteroidales bacterium]|nr:2-dehydropantoate 2-reductase [Bacteroidales bacterium]
MNNLKSKYLIIGAGGVGANLAAFLTLAGKEVTLIARGINLEVLQTEGLLLKSDLLGEKQIHPINALAEEDYVEQPDVIFLCTKTYGVKEVVPFLNRITTPNTLIIPLLNGFHIGRAIQSELAVGTVLEGCIYILGTLLKPGVARQQNAIFRIVFGLPKERKELNLKARMEAVQYDLSSSGIKATLSDDIERDTFMKWSFISATALVGAYFDVPMGVIQHDEKIRNIFIALSKESEALASAMGMKLTKDLTLTNLQVLDKTSDDATSSLQKDLKKGKSSEIDELVFKMITLGAQYNVPMIWYENLS